jgi:urease accessory protein
MPETASGLTYGAGFVAATATLHAIGVCLGLLFGRLSERGGLGIARTAGGGMALAGIGLLSGMI